MRRMPCCDIFTVFDENNLLIKEYKYWKLLVRNRNTTLGNCVAITKRHLEQFSDITPQEMQEFQLVVKDVEHSLEEIFNYDKINYMMLMMKDNHTHFHIIPRYAEARNFADIVWKDTSWPGVKIETAEPVSKEVLLKVKKELQKHL